MIKNNSWVEKYRPKSLDDVDPGYLRYGNGSSSDYKLFDNDIHILDNYRPQ